jgi:hypothetical protein
MNGEYSWIYMVGQLQGKRADQYTNEAIVNAIARDNKWIYKGSIQHKMPNREPKND